MSEPKAFSRHVEVAAHRGYSRFYPENTLPAFEAALRLPVDSLEFDLHMTRDREIVLMHDHKVDRTTDGSGPVRSFTSSQIKTLDAGSWKGEEFAGTRVPLFSELLDMLADYPDITINVELKDYPEHGAEWAFESAGRIIRMLEKHKVLDRCFINSWSGEMLEYVDREYDHSLRLHGYFPLELMGRNLTRDPYEYLYCICLFGSKEKPVCDRESFDYVISRGVAPWVHYPDDNPDSYEEALRYGAQLITANDPAFALAYLQEHGYRKP